jgi:hypothetical protein
MVNVNKEARRWNKFSGLYKGFENDDGMEDPAWEEVYNKVESFQGRIVVRSRHVGGHCEECGRVAQIAVHVEKREGESWARRNEWDNVKVVCHQCRNRIVAQRD